MTLAKPLGAGLPIGVTLATEKAGTIFSPGDHASTFGGGPLICSVALRFLEIMEREKLVERAEEVGAYFKEKLELLKEKYPFIHEIRGKGLMLGMKLRIERKSLIDRARDKGLLINVTAGNVLRFLPPLVVTHQDIDEAVYILEQVLKEV
jgi:acetylornithine/succinyldiaminopimelate/putrescine aminotransferase